MTIGLNADCSCPRECACKRTNTVCLTDKKAVKKQSPIRGQFVMGDSFEEKSPFCYIDGCSEVHDKRGKSHCWQRLGATCGIVCVAGRYLVRRDEGEFQSSQKSFQITTLCYFMTKYQQKCVSFISHFCYYFDNKQFWNNTLTSSIHSM